MTYPITSKPSHSCKIPGVSCARPGVLWAATADSRGRAAIGPGCGGCLRVLLLFAALCLLGQWSALPQTVGASGAEWVGQPAQKDATITCPNGALAQGVRCFGPLCDKKQLLCRRYTEALELARHEWSPWVFGRIEAHAVVDSQAFASALQDDNNWIRIRYSTSERVAHADSCLWQSAPGDSPYDLVCPEDHYVSGISCSGDYCQLLSLYCCLATFAASETDAAEDVDRAAGSPAQDLED